MNCRECEMALGLELNSSELKQHLHACETCRTLAGVLRANSEAFLAMAAEEMPGVPPSAPAHLAIGRWGWALAAAAMLAVMFLIPRVHEEESPPPTLHALAPVPVSSPPPPRIVRPIVKPIRKQARAANPVMVKMLTDDPQVVIYWQVDAEVEGDRQ